METVTPEIPRYYQPYVTSLDGLPFAEALGSQLNQTPRMIRSLTPEQENFQYAPGKWTVKEVLLHMMDCERIFAYRALCISRNDPTHFPPFEENDYVPMSGARDRTASSLADEYEAVRKATLTLLTNLTPEQLNRTGTANDSVFTPGMIGLIIAGHEKHHLGVLRSRYGIGV